MKKITNFLDNTFDNTFGSYTLAKKIRVRPPKLNDLQNDPSFNSLDEKTKKKLVKHIKVRLYLLGCSFLFATIAFSILSILIGIFTKAYVTTSSVDGVVRLQLENLDNNNYLMNNLSYCAQTHPSPDGFPCWVMDPRDAQFPPEEDEAIFITTRMTQTQEIRQCSLMDPDCEQGPFAINSTETAFIANPESFSLRVDHSFIASDFFNPKTPTKWARNAAQMNGRFIFSNGTWFNVDRQTDFSISMFLEAAGVDLDKNSDLDPLSMFPNGTNRYIGVSLIVYLDYNNFFASGLIRPDTFSYTIRVSKVPNTKYKIQDPLYFSPDMDSRIVRDLHGVNLSFIQTGDIGNISIFKIVLLLISVVTGNTLIVTIWNMLALKCCGLGKIQTDKIALISKESTNKKKKKKKSFFKDLVHRGKVPFSNVEDENEGKHGEEEDEDEEDEEGNHVAAHGEKGDAEVGVAEDDEIRRRRNNNNNNNEQASDSNQSLLKNEYVPAQRSLD